MALDKVAQAEQSMIRNLEEKTGKSFEQWKAIARTKSELKHKELVKHLQAEYGLTFGYANVIVIRAREEKPAAAAGTPQGELGLVEAQYAGEKAPLRTIYEEVIGAVNAFGADIEISPKKAYVSLRRSKQFAIVQPSTKTRIDIGINLKGLPPGGRLEASGSFNAMVSHRVRVESAADVDNELIAWLKKAYEQA